MATNRTGEAPPSLVNHKHLQALAEINSLRGDSLIKGIRECLARETIGSSLGGLAVVDGLLVSITSIYESVADELGDDIGI